MRGRHRYRSGRKPGRIALAVMLTTALASAGLAAVTPAHAFKPYTHVGTGDDARTDVIADGKVTIEGREYAVPQPVVDALRDHPAHYNAGVIGPDGFPDLVMGQSIIHPENTGLWLRHIMARAWEAQSDPAYSATQRSQILAFAYGYLTHASGDLWMHTMVNEFAEGVFPGVKEILTDVDAAEIALRHLVVEGYVGDATPGYDGNPTRALLGSGDVSDDSTRGIAFEAPLTFVQRTLVDRVKRDGAGNVVLDGGGNPIPNGPAQDRGALLDFFYAKRASLAAEVAESPDPLGAALARYSDYKQKFAEVSAPATCRPEDAQTDDDGDGAPDDGCGDDDDPDRVGRGEDESGPCSFGAGNTGIDVTVDVLSDIVSCPIALAGIGLSFAGETLAAFGTFVATTLDLALDTIVDAYLAAWVEDIDAGLEAWPQLGLALTRALFDPQARRDTQQDECDHLGPDTTDETTLRSKCEDGIGAVDVVFHEADPFINDHLLSMLGLPDVVGDARALLQEIADKLDAILGPALNPIRMPLNALKEEAKRIVKDEVNRRLGIDIDQIQDFLDSPSSKMDVGGFSITLPVVGTVGAQLFRVATDATHPETDHTKLDRYLGITDTDHHDGRGGGLGDDVVFDAEKFRAYRNTVVLNKMLLLDGAGMDALLSDLTGSTYSFYAGKPLANVMLTPLPGGTGPAADQWLTLIDGDHAWRADGAPVFARPSGGEGNFPLWESCVLRDKGFRALFRDWENDAGRDGILGPGENFPDLGDAASADPNDPSSPVSQVLIGSPNVVDGTTTYVSGATPLTLDASDVFWKPEHIDVTVRILDADAVVLRSEVMADGAAISLAGLSDGTYTVETTARDDCATETTHAVDLVVDNTPPVVTFTSPVPGGLYDTDDAPVVDYGVTDALSGVASHVATFDGAPTADGTVLDMFFLMPGLHTVSVVATDRLGNSGTTDSVFRLRATSTSLLSNVERARTLGLITNNGAYNGLRAKLDAAIRSHERDMHAVEHNQLAAFVNQLAAHAGRGIDAATAARFTAYAEDLILAGG